MRVVGLTGYRIAYVKVESERNCALDVLEKSDSSWGGHFHFFFFGETEGWKWLNRTREKGGETKSLGKEAMSDRVLFFLVATVNPYLVNLEGARITLPANRKHRSK